MFDPQRFIKTAAETWDDRVAYQKFLKENEHLAMPFHIKGLESIVPMQFPGELAVYEARSHHGKSAAVRDVVFQSQQRVEGRKGSLVGLVSLEDTSEGTASKAVKRYGGDSLAYQDDQFVFVGNSFGMTAEDMGQMNVTNIISTLDYGRYSKFAEVMQYAFIGIDYAQLISPDPERRVFTNNDQKRLQVADDIKRIYHAAKYFKCPIGIASQALIKEQKSNYTTKMKIPGAADLKEAGELFEVPDIVYAYWQPKHDHPIGSMVSEGQWNFKVEPNLGFVRIVKRRNAEEMGYVGKKDIIGRVFPFHIQEDGSFVYSAEYHRSITLKSVEQILNKEE